MKYSMQHIPAICAQCRQNTAAFSFLKEAVQVSRHPFFFYIIISKTCNNPLTAKQRLACYTSVTKWPPCEYQSQRKPSTFSKLPGEWKTCTVTRKAAKSKMKSKCTAGLKHLWACEEKVWVVSRTSNRCARWQAAIRVELLRRIELPQNQHHPSGTLVCLEHIYTKSTEKRCLNVQKTCRLTLRCN